MEMKVEFTNTSITTELVSIPSMFSTDNQKFADYFIRTETEARENNQYSQRYKMNCFKAAKPPRK